MQTLISTELAKTISDRGMGMRYRFETRLTPDKGENALYHKGGEIALHMWANAGTPSHDPIVLKNVVDKWLPKFKNIDDVKLVRAKVGDREVDAYYMIGDIKKGIEILSSNTEFGISGLGAEALLHALDEATKIKAKIDSTPPRSLPGKPSKARRTKPTED